MSIICLTTMETILGKSNHQTSKFDAICPSFLYHSLAEAVRKCPELELVYIKIQPVFIWTQFISKSIVCLLHSPLSHDMKKVGLCKSTAHPGDRYRQVHLHWQWPREPNGPIPLGDGLKASLIPLGTIAYFLSRHAMSPSGPCLHIPPALQIRQGHLFLSHRIKAAIN